MVDFFAFQADCVSSNLTTRLRGYISNGRIFALHVKGYRFKSDYLHNYFKSYLAELVDALDLKSNLFLKVSVQVR